MRNSTTALAGLTLAALGVVFGDIGTSPLYAINTVFALDGGVVRPTRTDVYGVMSLVFWAVTLIVSIKYVALVMRADNDGEGGIMALTALVQRASRNVVAGGTVLTLLGVVGASLFYGDSVITPAISVLSAVEGLNVAAPGLGALVVPIAVAILTALFAVQRWGTQAVGWVFGPVMVIWFVAIGAAGTREVVAHPEVVEALVPSHAFEFVLGRPGVAFVAAGAVMLAITGAEALYADMGHFGRRPIRRAWFGLVFPALTLNYLGQSALILHDRGAVESPFFLLLPHWARVPMVFLATAATIIASQAVISGAFSVSRQAVQLGFLPRLTIRHTSTLAVGQVYVPAVNWAMFVVVVSLVIGFGSSERLGSAYGVAVGATFVITTILFFTIARARWRWPAWAVACGVAVFLTVEVTFLAANLTKIHRGGWLPLVIASGFVCVMTTWHRGREIVTANRVREEGPLRRFIDALHALDPPLPRVSGTAVFLHPSLETTPLAMRANVEHNHVLHEHVVIVWAKPVDVAHVPPGDRVVVDDLGYSDDNITHVTARFGLQDPPDIPEALRLAQSMGVEWGSGLERPTYFLSRISIRVTAAPGMARWRKKLFVAMARNAATPTDYFRLPDERAITMGSRIPL